MDAACLAAAPTAARDAPGRSDVDHEPGWLEVEAADHEVLDGEKGSE